MYTKLSSHQRAASVVVAALLALASGANAQESPNRLTPEVRPFVGAFVPTGGMQQELKSATMAGAQVALEMNRNFHVLGSIGWTHGHHKLTVGTDRTNIWQYDMGVEGNLYRPVGDEWLLRPFLGVGAGARTYDYRAKNVGTKSCTAGYASLGTELQRHDVAFRVEGRDYLSCFESPVSGRKSTLNDVGISFGLAYHIR
jgi:hypothetical protein